MSFRPRDYRLLLVITLALLGAWLWLGYVLVCRIFGR